MVSRNEENDEFWSGLKLLPITFCTQRIDVPADFHRVLEEFQLARDRVRQVDRIAIRLNRRFASTTMRCPPGQTNDEIGAQRSTGFLLGEIGSKAACPPFRRRDEVGVSPQLPA